MFVRSIGLLTLLTLIASGDAVADEPLEETTGSGTALPLHLITERSPSALPDFVARRIQQDLAGRVNIPFERLEITRSSRQIWPDECLGLGHADESCEQKDVHGWSVAIYSSQQKWIYRSDRTAQRLRLEPLSEEPGLSQLSFSPETAKKLISTASEQMNYLIDELEILEVRAMNWDSCLGIIKPDEVCTEATVPGFQVIVGNGPRDNPGGDDPIYYWESLESGIAHKERVYHLNEDGSQIVHNAEASNENHLVAASFIREATPLEVAPDEVFKQKLSISGTSQTTTFTLKADGTVYMENVYYDFNSKSEERSAEIIKKVSPETVVAFKELVQAQRFSELDGMRYSNQDQSMAIDWDATVSTADTTVSFSAIGEDISSESMKRVVLAVEEITGQPLLGMHR